MILWLTKKDRIVRLNEAGTNLVNFQINWTAFLFLSFVVIIFSRPATILIIILYVCLMGINIILPIRIALKLRNGETGKYPTLIKIIK
jgi:uncharacterized Tic20 family protein